MENLKLYHRKHVIINLRKFESKVIIQIMLRNSYVILNKNSGTKLTPIFKVTNWNIFIHDSTQFTNKNIYVSIVLPEKVNISRN